MFIYSKNPPKNLLIFLLKGKNPRNLQSIRKPIPIAWASFENPRKATFFQENPFQIEGQQDSGKYPEEKWAQSHWQSSISIENYKNNRFFREKTANFSE